MNPRIADVMPVNEKPIHIPRVPPIDPTMSAMSYTNCSLCSIACPGCAKLYPYVGKHLSLRGGIDFEGPWRNLGGEPKESPSLRGGIRKFDQF